MTDQQPPTPPPPDQPTQPGPAPGWGPPPGPPSKARRTFSGRLVAALTFTAFAIGLLIGIVATSGGGNTSTSGRPNAAATTRPAATTPATEEVTTSPASTYPEPKPGDFKLTVKVLKKENFGTAGSNITFRIEASWDKTYDPGKTYEVTYEVRGPEDGPMINTFTVTGDRYETTREELASTRSASTKLTAKVTDVSEA